MTRIKLSIQSLSAIDVLFTVGVALVTLGVGARWGWEFALIFVGAVALALAAQSVFGSVHTTKGQRK